MPYRVIYDDITKFKGDAIVNSLGKEGSVYGAICDAIITSANDKELKKYID